MGTSKKSAATAKPARKRFGSDWDKPASKPKKPTGNPKLDKKLAEKEERKAEKIRLRDEKQRRKLKEKEERRNQPKKPLLVRFYNALKPGDYTPRQDLLHVLLILGICAALCGAIFYAWRAWSDNVAYNLSAELFIPAAAYTSGQESNIVENLEQNGFQNIYVDEDGNYHAFGNPDRVQNYKNSYYERTVKIVSDYLDDDYGSYGIANIYVSSDWSKMIIDTIYDEIDSSVITYMFTNADLLLAIRTYAVWYQLNSGGDMMEFIIRAADGTTLIDEEISSAEEIISAMQNTDDSSDDEADDTSDDSSDDETDDTSEDTDDATGSDNETNNSTEE